MAAHPIPDLLVSPRKYCNSLTAYSRFRTREVAIGDVPLGGDHPIRVQSMTTTPTMDTKATVAQSIRMIEAGCEYVRITAPSKNEAENLAHIKRALRNQGYTTPLVADIHYTPNAAEIAARIVEKVRINPGNYADKKKFQIVEYTDAQYRAELHRIREKFLPLVNICKTYGTAMRIGTNHGSLSDRIMSHFGDTPLGMVESALEFARICADEGYHNLVFSMKASNPQVMVQAYRLLVHKMEAEGMNYPLHLGVTEAGDGEDGRIKSAAGIGALLEDGLGDTVRVSLTEDPEAEIPVARALVARYAHRKNHAPIPALITSPIDPFAYTRRATRPAGKIGAAQVPAVIASRPLQSPGDLTPLGYAYDPTLDKWHIADMAVDFIYTGDLCPSFPLPGTLGIILDAPAWSPDLENAHPLFTPETYRPSDKELAFSDDRRWTIDDGKSHDAHHRGIQKSESLSEELSLRAKGRSATLHFIAAHLTDLTPAFIQALKADPTAVLVLQTDNAHAMPELRRAFIQLIDAQCDIPVVVRRTYAAQDLMLHAATDLGPLFIDGLGDGAWPESQDADPDVINRAAFGILQATRTRISKTEYISCPSCGRTLFDLQETTARIRARTHHLKGVKIGIMGCIVNGPGEMADADYGYVGSGPGKITLYRNKDIVKRNIPAENAVDALIALIREDGNWIDHEAVKSQK